MSTFLISAEENNVEGSNLRQQFGDTVVSERTKKGVKGKITRETLVKVTAQSYSSFTSQRFGPIPVDFSPSPYQPRTKASQSLYSI